MEYFACHFRLTISSRSCVVLLYCSSPDRGRAPPSSSVQKRKQQDTASPAFCHSSINKGTVRTTAYTPLWSCVYSRPNASLRIPSATAQTRTTTIREFPVSPVYPWSTLYSFRCRLQSSCPSLQRARPALTALAVLPPRSIAGQRRRKTVPPVPLLGRWIEFQFIDDMNGFNRDLIDKSATPRTDTFIIDNTAD